MLMTHFSRCAAAEVSPVADTAAKGSSQASTTYVLCDGGVVANNPSAEAVAFTSIAYGQNNELVSPKVQLHASCRTVSCWHICCATCNPS